MRTELKEDVVRKTETEHTPVISVGDENVFFLSVRPL